MTRPARNALKAEDAEGPLDALLADPAGRDRLERDILPAFLAGQRWFAGKGGGPARVRIRPLGGIAGAASRLTILDIGSGPGLADAQSYFLPLSAHWRTAPAGDPGPVRPDVVALLDRNGDGPLLVDAVHDEGFVRGLLAAMQRGGSQAVRGGVLRFTPAAAFRNCDISGEIRASGAEQSNASVRIGGALMLKIYRRLRPGVQPEIEMAHFLTGTAGFGGSPTFFGSAEYCPRDGEPVALAAAFAFVPNRGDAWSVILQALDEALAAVATEKGHSPIDAALDLVAAIGRRTAGMHAALATPTDDADFAAEPAGGADLQRWVGDAIGEAQRSLARLEATAPSLPEDVRANIALLLETRREILAALAAMRDIPSPGLKIRIHGDYHLGQILVDADRDVVIVDFEGEPLRPIAERRSKTSPLRDVAGLLRSLDYAAWSALDALRRRGGPAGERQSARVIAWRDAASRVFLDAYWVRMAEAGPLFGDVESRRRVLNLFLLSKAFYEIEYEAANRPSWLSIPVRGVLDLVKDLRSAPDIGRDRHD